VTFSFHAQAKEELEQAFSFYRQQGSDSVAEAFLQEIDRVAELLWTHPGFGRSIGGGRRLYNLRRFPYLVIYRVTHGGIEILVVGHQHRRPGYWKGRT
jgi:toxin ParE1/3/4